MRRSYRSHFTGRAALASAILLALSGGWSVAHGAEIPMTGATKLLIVASEGKWNFKSSPSAGSVHIEGGDFDGLFTVTRKEDRVEIVDRRDYIDAPKSHTPKEYQVVVPAHLNLEMHLATGELTGMGLKGDGLLDMQSGKIIWTNAQGFWNIHLHKGDLELVANEARLIVDQYSGHCAVRGQQGDLQVSEFLGELAIDKAQGSLHLALGSGSTKVLNSGGNLLVDSSKATISVPQFAGPIEGNLQEGTLNLQLSDDSDVRLKSQAAKIILGATPETGLSLNLANVEGEINLPNPLRVARDSSGKFFRGKWKGERTNLARVQIRAQEGVITVR